MSETPDLITCVKIIIPKKQTSKKYLFICNLFIVDYNTIYIYI